MHRSPRSEQGLSTLELGIVLPLLLVMVSFIVPVMQAGWGYMVTSRAASHGIRYASRAEENVRYTDAGQLSRRPTASEVEAFVREAADPIDLAEVTTLVGAEPADPSGALPGETITIVVTYEASFGPLGTAANALHSRMSGTGGALLPVSTVVSVSAKGRME